MTEPALSDHIDIGHAQRVGPRRIMSSDTATITTTCAVMYSN
jgi:hypothetical protein